MSGDSVVNLIRSVNQIARNVVHEPDPVGMVADHVAAFWSGRMRAQIAAQLAAHGDEGLDRIAFDALLRLGMGGTTPPLTRATDPAEQGADGG